MAKYYLTFGLGSMDGGKYTEIEAPGYQEARDKAFKKYGPAWAFCYDSNGWKMESGKTQAEEYSLKLKEKI